MSRDGAVIETRTFSQGLIRIGRMPQAKDGPIDVVLTSDRVSGLHAQIVVGEAGLTLVDRSRNGTFVNGELVQAPRPLGPNDRIEIDVFTVRCERLGVDAPPATGGPRSHDTHEAPNVDFDLAPVDDDLPIIEDLGPDLLGGEASEPPAAALRAPSPGRAPPGLDSSIAASREPISMEAPPRFDLEAAPIARDDARPSPLHESRPAPPPIEPRAAEAPSDALGEAYRQLAARFGAPGWGRPTGADPSALTRVLEAARLAVRARPGAIADDTRWAEWLARELCGLDPIRTLLDDVAVTGIVVHGAHGITVHRGDAHETAALRFSCVESVLAAIERWTGRPLHGAPIEHVSAGLVIHAFDRGLVPSGPMVIVRRAGVAQRSLAELVDARVLPAAAAELLRACLTRGLNLLLCGDNRVDPTALLIALRGELAPDRLVAVIQRTSTWSPTLATALDGHQEVAVIWRCIERLRPDWLIVEELRGSDLGRLIDLGRHRGGGSIASTQALGGDDALVRLAALLAAGRSGQEVAACRAAITSSFDLIITLRERPGGAHVTSIAEVRGRGELAELFAWKSATASLEGTNVDSHLLTRDRP